MLYVTGGDDNKACIWSTTEDTEECECVGILEGHQDKITSVCVEECFILTGSADSTIRKWELSTCLCSHVYSGHHSTVNRIICAGYFIFSGSSDKTVRCWDFESGDPVRVFKGHKKSIFALIYIPYNGKEIYSSSNSSKTSDILITGSLDRTARIWNIETGKTIHTLDGHTGAVICLATNASGKIVFTGSFDTTICSWNTETGEMLKKFEGHNGSVVQIVVGKHKKYSNML